MFELPPITTRKQQITIRRIINSPSLEGTVTNPSYTPKPQKLQKTQLNTNSYRKLIPDNENDRTSIPDDVYFQCLNKNLLLKDHPSLIREQLNIIKKLPQPSPHLLFRKSLPLPARKYHKTLILDLDETLIHTSTRELSDIVLKDQPELCFSVRPYAREMLNYVSKKFEVVLFTASQKPYADRIIDYLDPNRDIFAARIYRESCISTDKGFIKDIRIFSNRSLENVVIVDNFILSFAFQLDNGIQILSWYGNNV